MKVGDCMAKFKIRFEGFAYIEAADEQEAVFNYDCEDVVYQESNMIGISEVDEFEIEND